MDQEHLQYQNSIGINVVDYSSDDSFSLTDSDFDFGLVIPIISSPTDDSIIQDDQDSDFEFGNLTPGSPSNDPNDTSPADILFFNGVLVPHSFPFQSVNHTTRSDNSRATSSTSSIISSKDSLMSSRSNSSNSRSSSGSSSTGSKLPVLNKVAATKPVTCNKDQAKRSDPFQPYAASQQWEFISVPILKISAKVLRRKKTEAVEQVESKLKKQVKKKSKAVKPRFGRRIFRWFVFACRECHALEPPMKGHELQEDIKLL